MYYERKLENLVVLGRSAPEEIKDGRSTVCLAGVLLNSQEFVRVYPTRMDFPISRWDMINVPVIHDPSHDAREESFKIRDSKEEWNNLGKKIKKVGRLKKRKRRLHLLSRLPYSCTKSLNQKHASLGLVKPTKILKAYLEENEKFSKKKLTKNQYPFKVRVRYQHGNCSLKGDFHDQHCIEWGIYRFWDKNGSAYKRVIDNLQLLNDNWEKFFLIGNLFSHLTSFVIISVLRFKHKKENFQQYLTNLS